MTRSMEIPEAAVEAAAKAACEATYPPNPSGRVKVHDSWEKIEEWERGAWRATASAALAVALPHLAPAEPTYYNDEGALSPDEPVRSGGVDPDIAPVDVPDLAPVGDGGLREALEKVKQAKRRLWAGLMAVKPKLDEPYPDDARWTPWTRFVGPRLDDLWAAFDALLLAVHPAAPAVPQPATDGATKLDCGVCYRDDSDPEKIVFTYLAECENHGRY